MDTRLYTIRRIVTLAVGVFILSVSMLPWNQSTSHANGSASTFTAGTVTGTRPTPNLMLAGALALEQAAPDFALPDLEGNTVWLSELRGKIVIVTFWATWCPPCQGEVEEFIAMYPELTNSGVALLAVNYREDADTVYRYIRDKHINYPVLLDTRGHLAYAYGVRGIPTSLFIDDSGILRYIQRGGLTRDMISRILDTLETN